MSPPPPVDRLAPLCRLLEQALWVSSGHTFIAPWQLCEALKVSPDTARCLLYTLATFGFLDRQPLGRYSPRA
jgi:hypothetical protein